MIDSHNITTTEYGRRIISWPLTDVIFILYIEISLLSNINRGGIQEKNNYSCQQFSGQLPNILEIEEHMTN